MKYFGRYNVWEPPQTNKWHLREETIVVIILLVLWLILGTFFIFGLCYAQGALQRHFLIPPFRGQISNFSEWTIPEQTLAELTNWYVNEQGMIISRPGFYCWKDSVSTTEPVYGAYEYRKVVEGGFSTELIIYTNQKLYSTDNQAAIDNTDISKSFTFSDDGNPVFITFYNEMFMANGEDSPIRYDQDANCWQIGRCTYSGTIIFTDANTLTSTSDFDSGDYHFRVGWDLIIADSNNDGTYEIESVDGNVIGVQTTAGAAVNWTLEQTDASVSLTGIGIPDELTTSRTETITASTYYATFCNNCPDGYGNTKDYVRTPLNFSELGFTAGMSLVINAPGTSHDGTFTIEYISGGLTPVFDSGSWSSNLSVKKQLVTFSATYALDTSNVFCPTTITGHKTRLFAGGVKEYPSYLFYTQSKLYTSYYYDLWRDRVGEDDGSGYIDLQDKIIALVPDFQGDLIILCRHSIWTLSGDDPGTDILTPTQVYVYHPKLITGKVGCVGPNAWIRIGNEIYFYSNEGLQQITQVAQTGELLTSLISLPVGDIHKTIRQYANIESLQIEFVPAINCLIINVYTPDTDNESTTICYNLTNNAYSIWTFPSSSTPLYIFKAKGFAEDPNIVGYPYKFAEPPETLWYGSEDGKLFSMHKSFAYDLDYEDPNNETLSNIDKTIITAKLNMGDLFLLKNWQRAVFAVRELYNYSADPNYGSISFYRKLDNGSWSSVSTRNFSTISGTDGDSIDQYKFLDMFSAVRGTSRTIQYKITSSSRYGLELMGIFTEYTPAGYTPFD